ncbi:MAG: histidine kinase [Clostridiales bacterium]|nr:histidine kinase [Clostridiales bacterium]
MLTRQSVHVSMLLWGSIFCAIAALCMYLCKSFEKEKRRWMILMQICCGMLLLNDALAWYYRGAAGKFAYGIVRLSNFFVFLFSVALIILFNAYICCLLFGTADLAVLAGNNDSKGNAVKIKRDFPIIRIYAVYIIAVIGIILVIVSQFTDLYYYIDTDNLYHRSRGYILSVIIPMLCMLIEYSIIVQYKQNIEFYMLISIISYLTLPFAATIALIFYYGISLVNIAIGVSMILMFITSMVEQSRIIATEKAKASDLKIELMMSQIAPHFIYNTLTTISQLCESDPLQAKETTIEFSNYLRGNLNALCSKECIPFKKELMHTRYYTAIEKKRFGSRINVVYNIEESDFMLPALTLQPLIENAIKHGLCMKDGGGTVRIITENKGESIYITVMDNGVGFDVNTINNDGLTHVGLKNVERRLKSMCGGSLEVSSIPGKGTMAVITLAKHI